MSLLSKKTPIRNLIVGINVKGRPTDGQTLQFNQTKNIFEWVDLPSGAGIISINNDIAAEQTFEDDGFETIDIDDAGSGVHKLGVAESSIAEREIATSGVDNINIQDNVITKDKFNSEAQLINKILVTDGTGGFTYQDLPTGSSELTNKICLPYYNGTKAGTSPQGSGEICIGVGDNDTIKQLTHDTAIVFGIPKSIHLSDDTTSYQNNSGNDAFVILVINIAALTGGTLAMRISDAPLDNSVVGGTTRYSNGGGITDLLDAVNQKQTIGPIKISPGNFCVIDTLTGTIDVNVIEGLAWVVERG